MVQQKAQASQAAPARTSAGSQTPQQYDISQGDVPMQTEPHVEDRRTQLLEQENEALLRQREQDRMLAERHSRLMESQFNEHLASLTRRDEEREAEMRQTLTQVQQSELAQAARLASAESQAERVIQQQQRQHEKQVE